MKAIALTLVLVSVSVLLSGCDLAGGENKRFKLHMAPERPTILLDQKSGKTWQIMPCPDNPNDYSCWQTMKYDKQPESN